MHIEEDGTNQKNIEKGPDINLQLKELNSSPDLIRRVLDMKLKEIL